MKQIDYSKAQIENWLSRYIPNDNDLKDAARIIHRTIKLSYLDGITDAKSVLNTLYVMESKKDD